MEFGEEAHEVVGRHEPRRRPTVEHLSSVQLNAIAGAEDHGLAAEACVQLVEGARQLVAVEGEALANLHGRAAVAAADGEQDHRTTPCPTGWARARQQTSSAKAK